MATNSITNQIGPQASFMSVNNADQNNVTGNGTTYTIRFANEIYDKTGSFDAASTFTANLTGIYDFSCLLYIADGSLTTVTALKIFLVTTGATYYLYNINLASGLPVGNTTIVCSFSQLCPMTAGDTAQVHILGTGAASNLIDLIGVTAANTRAPIFSGYMISGI